MRKLIEETDRYILFLDTGISKFRGCQCSKDCTCMADYIEKPYTYYAVKKKTGKIKTTNHNTLEDANKRIELLNSTKYLVKDR